MLKVTEQVIKMQNNRIYSDFDDMFAFWLKTAHEIIFPILNILLLVVFLLSRRMMVEMVKLLERLSIQLQNLRLNMLPSACFQKAIKNL